MSSGRSMGSNYIQEDSEYNKLVIKLKSSNIIVVVPLRFVYEFSYILVHSGVSVFYSNYSNWC